MDGEAESYRGVSVLFIDNLSSDPVMTLYLQQSGEELRRISLIHYHTMEELTALMTTELGFDKRTKKELAVYEKKQEVKQLEMDLEIDAQRTKEQQAMKHKKDEIADRVIKMMQANMKKQLEKNEAIQ